METALRLQSQARDTIGHCTNGGQSQNITGHNPFVQSNGNPSSGSGAQRSNRFARDGILFSRNCLLDSLMPSELCHLEPYIGAARLRRGEILNEAAERPERVWFPETCVVSLVVAMSTGNDATVGLIGREGVAGAGGVRQVVQVPGTARFLSSSAKQVVLDAVPNLQQLLKRHADALYGQILQIAACNALHPVEARLARFLLAVADRVEPHAPLPLTQDDLAHALGVQRSTVNVNAAAFQRAGLITYRRGVVEIRKRSGLEAVACECYGVVRTYYGLLLGGSNMSRGRRSLTGVAP
jgi:CRP-like cAMP-binding protein